VRMMTAHLKPTVILLALLTVVTGLLYPLVVTVIAQGIFPQQANGSLLVRNGQVVGSALVGQPFDEVHYFWSRPSATAPYPYNAAASAGANLGPTNGRLRDDVAARVEALQTADPGNVAPIPVDLVTASASGLDPHISVASAQYQIARVARARGLDEALVAQLVAQSTESRQFGILGEPRVNVLRLNLALDALQSGNQ